MMRFNFRHRCAPMKHGNRREDNAGAASHTARATPAHHCKRAA
jgi:hypothetical protein